MHDWTVTGTDGDGDFLGSCSCGYACIGGNRADVEANLQLHASGGWA